MKEILKLCFYFLHLVKMYSMCFSYLQKLHKQNLENIGKYRGRYSIINIFYIVLVYFLKLIIKCIYNIKPYIHIICACEVCIIYIFYNNMFICFTYVIFWGGMGRAWQFIPVILPGESYGQRSLMGYSP